MDNQQFNYQKRQGVRQAIESGFAMNPALRSLRAESKSSFGSVVADEMDAMKFRMRTCGDMQCDTKKLGDSIVAMKPQQQMRAIAEMQAMIDVYKDVFDEVRTKFGYQGTFEQYIEDVLAAAESADPDTPMEQIGTMVLAGPGRE